MSPVGANTEVDLYVRIANLEAVVFAGVPSGTVPAIIVGIEASPVQIFATAGAAVIKPQGGYVFFTAAGAVLATLAAPIAGAPNLVSGGQDGMQLICFDLNTAANTITTPANAINGNKLVATDGAARANTITFNAFNGVWYANANVGFTLT